MLHYLLNYSNNAVFLRFTLNYLGNIVLFSVTKHKNIENVTKLKILRYNCSEQYN